MASDPGIANERTALAWQRTALSLVAGAAIVARIGAEEAGSLIVVIMGVAVVLGVWVLAESSGRYRHSSGSKERARGRGGRAALALAIATALIAVGELTVLLR